MWQTWAFCPIPHLRPVTRSRTASWVLKYERSHGAISYAKYRPFGLGTAISGQTEGGVRKTVVTCSVLGSRRRTAPGQLSGVGMNGP